MGQSFLNPPRQSLLKRLVEWYVVSGYVKAGMRYGREDRRLKLTPIWLRMRDGRQPWLKAAARLQLWELRYDRLGYKMLYWGDFSRACCPQTIQHLLRVFKPVVVKMARTEINPMKSKSATKCEIHSQ